MSTKAALKRAIEVIELAKLTSREVTMCSAMYDGTSDLFLTDEAFIRTFHFFRLKKKDITAKIVDDVVHIKFAAKGVVFSACIRLEKAAAFIDANQQRLPASTGKRIAGGDCSETSRNQSGPRRLAFSGEKS
jgi:hypothetical protein